jgi:hypothetical protein
VLRRFAQSLAVAVALLATVDASATPASDFSPRVTNPWYPLAAGSSYVYGGEKDGQPARDVLTVTHRIKVVAGVPCVVIQDRLYLSGHLAERTTEWFSQDKHGNVWYFGEDTAELDKNGRVLNTEGTWRAGVKGAEPGIFMFAHPVVGKAAQQEFYKGEAEDHFQVLSLRAKVSVPYTSSTHALLTKEWTPLEPNVVDHKLYIRGIGTVLEQTVKGASERFELVSFRRGG